MFACHKCKKQLSSKQALNYHLSSSACIPRSASKEKMKFESELIIECTLDGIIKDYYNKGTPLRTSSVIGKSLYDVLESSCKYEMSLKHIQSIAHKGTVYRLEYVTVERILCRESKIFSCILLSDEDSLVVYLSDTN